MILQTDNYWLVNYEKDKTIKYKVMKICFQVVVSYVVMRARMYTSKFV